MPDEVLFGEKLLTESKGAGVPCQRSAEFNDWVSGELRNAALAIVLHIQMRTRCLPSRRCMQNERFSDLHGLQP